ncbi:MAG TPA: flagellar biosynthesis anti-sigma factor FlgM [Longimicrobiaceae bacterium]|nr:flagellar biosynthesis anti-sigma factor FlgM [Longimicrobiaceae bacterium]
MSIRIDSLGVEPHRSDAAKGVRGTGIEGQDKQAAQPVSAPQRPDQVEISEAGRALAAQIGTEAASAGALTGERVAEIRQRVLTGAYDSTAIVEEVARRMLSSGDI